MSSLSNTLSSRLAFFCGCLPILATAVSAVEPGRGSIAIVDEGKPVARIVLAENPPRYTQVAALELQHYVERSTGAVLPITTDGLPDAGNGFEILVGESRLTRELGLRGADFNRDEILVETRGTKLILMGRDEPEFGWVTYEENGHWPGFWPEAPDPKQKQIWKLKGSLHAVYEFLEKAVGVRWYMVTDIGEVVPQHDSLTAANLFIRRKPWCATRRFNIDMASPRHFYERWGAKGSPLGSKSIHELGPGHRGWRHLFMWLERVRYGGVLHEANHSLYSYFDRFGEDHPDWFADSNPVHGAQMCYQNEGLIDRVAGDINQAFDNAYPDGRYPGIDRAYWIAAAGRFHAVVPMDNDKYCQCERCAPKWRPGEDWMFFGGRRSDYVWAFVNEVAERVYPRHPDKYVSALAYYQYTDPPSFELAPNVAVMYCKSMSQYGDPRRREYDRQNLVEWRKRTPHLSTWEYYNFPRGPVFPGVSPHRIAEDIAFLRELPIEGMFIELDSVNPAIEHINLYVTMKLLDDPATDVDALLEEYYRLFYGPAEEPMRAFFEKIEAIGTDPEHWKAVLARGEEHLGRQVSWDVMCPPAVLAGFGALIERAKAAAGDAQPYRDRVDLMDLAVYGHMTQSAADYRRHSRTERPGLAIPFVSSPPSNGGVWDGAAFTGPFRTITGQEAELDTRGWIVAGEHGLHFIVEAMESDMGSLRMRHKDPDSNVYEEDCIEIFIQQDETVRSFYQIAFNPRGTVNDARLVKGKPRDETWDSGMELSVERREDRWVARGAIPWTSLGRESAPRGEQWRFNICRDRPRGGPPGLYAWAPTFTSWHELEYFGRITFTGSGQPRPPGTSPAEDGFYPMLGPYD